ncbi:MAG: GatB/YqeY domain-containing protein [Gammaproteobacteria bacterium]
MSLKDRLQEEMQAAMRSGDKPRLSVLRLALAGVKQREVDTRRPLDDAGVQSVIERMIKQGRDSVSQYRDGGRQDLVDKEEAEIKVLQTYLPQQLSDAELDTFLAECIEASGALSVKDLGKVMGAVKGRAAGRVDMSTVSARVRAMLTPD